MRILLALLLFCQLSSSAVTTAPVVLRACLNNNDSVVTLSWTNITDACGSFSHYTIYGNEDLGAYKRIANIPALATNIHSFSINNLNNNRSYFIRVFYLCDMADSATSNVVNIDITKPSTSSLDSVSFDLLTQNIIAGWKENSAPDRMGYRIYKFNSGINDSIGETSNTSFIVSTDPSDVFDVTLSAYDSCLLFSPISAPHRPVVLSGSIDTCLREISLNWTLYKGWSSIDSQVLLINKNGSGYRRYQSMGTGATSFTYTDFILGDQLCFIVRSYTSAAPISSTSNISCIQTRAFQIPNYLYLSRVSVNDQDEIELDWRIDNTTDVRRFDILRADNQGVRTKIDDQISGASLLYNYLDPSADVNSLFYSYEIQAFDQCNDLILASNVSQSIHLSIDDLLKYNAYLNWDGGVEHYDVEYSDFSRSTWNTYLRTSDVSTSNKPDSAACYRINAQENINAYEFAANSYSNVVCLEPPMRVYTPNSIVLSGENNRFVVLGTGIDHLNSTFEIYNRWGEMIVQNPTDQPWYGDYLGKPVLPGIYVYVVRVRGTKGELDMLKGVLRVIE